MGIRSKIKRTETNNRDTSAITARQLFCNIFNSEVKLCWPHTHVCGTALRRIDPALAWPHTLCAARR
jgi:hypothetical protein